MPTTTKKKRVTPFNEKHILDYGLKVSGRSLSGLVVESVMCRFCFTFGKEGKERKETKKNNNEEWKRDLSDNVKYFTFPIRVDNYVSHLKCHKEKWKLYCRCSTEEKRKFFDIQEVPFANSILSHFNSKNIEEKVFYFDVGIVEKLIGDMLFDIKENDDDDTNLVCRERALSIFKKKAAEGNAATEGYTASVKNMTQYRLTVKFAAKSSSFKQIVSLIQATKEELHQASLGCMNMIKVIEYIRILLASSLQNIKELLKVSWCYSAAFDSATYQHSSYFDVRVRVYKSGTIVNIHVLAIPMFERHTGEYMFELFQKLFDELDPMWRQKLIGVTSDGARSMTGLERGVVTRIQNAALPQGFYRIWCALHQLDLVVQKSMKIFSDTPFYSTLTALIAYLRRQQNFIQEIKSKCPKVADTRWLSLGKVCNWLCKYRIQIIGYFDSKNPKPPCTPTLEWWVIVATMAKIMSEVDISFVSSQGLRTLLQEQSNSLAKLKTNLLNMSGRVVAANENEQMPAFIVRGCYKIEKEDATKMIKDCGLFCENVLAELPEAGVRIIFVVSV